MYPGGWVPDQLYQPPKQKKLKKRALKKLKELYDEAREIIPETLQAGLVPAAVLVSARASVSLPPPSQIDFEALARSLETIRVLIAAVEAQRAADAEAERAEREKIKRRRREEETLIFLLTELLSRRPYASR